MISVLITAYNQRDRVEEAVASVEKQNFKDWEIIIGDDGSAPQERLDDFCKKRGYEYIFQKDKGFRVSSLRNKLAQAAFGGKLVFLDGDNTLVGKDFLGRLDKRLKDYAIVGFDKMKYRDDILVEKVSNGWQSGHHAWWNYRGGAMAVWKNVFRSLGGFDQAFDGSWGMEDSDFILRAMKDKIKMTADESFQVKHKWHEKNYDAKPIENMDLLLEKHGKFIVWGWWSIDQ